MCYCASWVERLDMPARLIIRLLFGFASDKFNQSTNTDQPSSPISVLSPGRKLYSVVLPVLGKYCFAHPRNVFCQFAEGKNIYALVFFCQN